MTNEQLKQTAHEYASLPNGHGEFWDAILAMIEDRLPYRVKYGDALRCAFDNGTSAEEYVVDNWAHEAARGEVTITGPDSEDKPSLDDHSRTDAATADWNEPNPGTPQSASIYSRGVHPQRDWVYADDYAALEAERDSLADDCEALKQAVFEAHAMGRIYARGGEVDKPSDEYQRVNEMIDRRLAAQAAAGMDGK